MSRHAFRMDRKAAALCGFPVTENGQWYAVSRGALTPEITTRIESERDAGRVEIAWNDQIGTMIVRALEPADASN